LLEIGLESRGYGVLLAGEGEEALRIVEHRPIDVLVTDVLLPGLSGPEVAERARQARPEVGVVFMSGFADGLIAGEVLVDEGVPFLQKPFSVSDLAEEIFRVVSG
jgi:CheY-like chemotaxis protein